MVFAPHKDYGQQQVGKKRQGECNTRTKKTEMLMGQHRERH